MFERGERNRRADRARMASLGGYVGRNVGDQPYIMDMVLQEHFLSVATSGTRIDGTPFSITTAGSGGVLPAVPSSVRLFTGTTASSASTADTPALSALTGYTRDTSLRSRWKISAIDATTSLLVGLRSSGSVLSAADGIFFGAMGAVSTTHFVVVTRSGGAPTIRVLNGEGGRATIALDTVTHDSTIVCDSTTGVVRFYFGNALAETIDSDIPTGNLAVVMGAENGTLGGTNRDLYVDAIMVSEAAA